MMVKNWILAILFVLINLPGIGQQTESENLKIPIAGAAWWSGVTNHGELMPLKNGYVADFRSNYGNQIQPLLISNQGETVWSEEPFTLEVRDDTLCIRAGDASLIYHKSGTTLKQAFRYASTSYFPPVGILPDELLFSAPQYNTWIELQYDQNQNDILQYARDILDNGFPPGVLMIDDNWQEDYGKWDFHPGRFPNPLEMMDSLHQMGFKVMVWICPFISPDCDVYRFLEKGKMLLRDQEQQTAIVRWWNGASGLLDLSNEATVSWFKEQLDYLQSRYHVDGFKLDAGDPEYYEGLVADADIGPNDHCALFAKVGLDYPLNEYRAMWKMGGQPIVNRLRDKYHTWEDARKLIPDILVQGIVGYNFTCPDMVGGGDYSSFLPGAVMDQDLIVRSAQTHALMPMMQFSVAPWRVLDEAHFLAVKEAVKIRIKYTPQIMELARKSALDGEPIVRSMEYVFPHQGYESIDDQFLLGDKILVAPMLIPGEGGRKVILPEGRWRSSDGKTVKGPKVLDVTVGLSEIPIFERELD